MPSEPFPSGRQIAVTWGLERTFGGMTAVMLRRSRAFAAASGHPVDILTFDARDDYETVLAGLRAGGSLPSTLRVRNLWDELTAETIRGPAPTTSKTAALAGFAPLGTGGRSAVRRAADGGVLQLDRRRPDGTLALSDRRDTRVLGAAGGRSIVLCDADGEPAFGFTRARHLYHWWLDRVVGDEDAFLIVDSKTVAGTVLDYRSPRATRIHVLHNSHLEGDSRPWGPLKRTRADVLSRLDDLDAAVVLSERQRDDLALLLGPSDAVAAVPNAVALPNGSPAGRREPGRGVLLASLTGRKRVDDGIRAIALARSGGADVRLDIYGGGPLRAELEELIARLGVEDAVTLHGFRPDAFQEFSGASFFLLTSRTEGFPLVLAEGMSRGCIPISYDIPYGPADVVEDGKSGYLIPSGDVRTLAKRVAALADGVPAGMREAAAARAARFSDEAVLAQWPGVLKRARERHLRESPAFGATVHASRMTRRRASFRVEADFSLSAIDVPPRRVAAAVTLRGPGTVVLRAVGSVRRTLRHGVWRATVDFPPGAGAWLPPGIRLTQELELRIGGGVVRRPLDHGETPTP